MEVEDKKTDIKAEPKEEEEGGANSTTSSSSPLQSRRKSECDAGGRVNCGTEMFFSSCAVALAASLAQQYVLTTGSGFFVFFSPMCFQSSSPRSCARR